MLAALPPSFEPFDLLRVGRDYVTANQGGERREDVATVDVGEIDVRRKTFDRYWHWRYLAAQRLANQLPPQHAQSHAAANAAPVGDKCDGQGGN
jgi:hypothetical protein